MLTEYKGMYQDFTTYLLYNYGKFRGTAWNRKRRNYDVNLFYITLEIVDNLRVY